MRDFDGPQEFLQSLRDADILTRPSSLLYVQALKFLQTRATPPAARQRAAGRGGCGAAARTASVTRSAEVAGGSAQVLMHRQGQAAAPSNPSGSMPVTDDEIREKYLERAIRELNTLTRELQACPHCPRGNLMPVLGSGHPQADIMLLKYAPLPSEIEEGVAFYGRAGGALMKSLKRLQIDPLAVYGTLCVKCPLSDASLADFACIARVVEEIAIVQPKIVVVMGAEALAALERDGDPAGAPAASRRLGEIQQLTPTIDALYVPNIDDSLDETGRQARRSGRRSACSATGTRRSRRTDRSQRARARCSS